MKRTGQLITTAVAMSAAGLALGANELQIDVNSLTVSVMQAPPVVQGDGAMQNRGLESGFAARGAPSFGTDFTGSVSMVDDSDSILAGILCDGVAQSFNGTLDTFTGQINFLNGDVTGGSFTVTVLESDGVTTNSYSASILGGVGAINTQAGQGFSIDGLTFAGMFSSPVFAGVDVTRWDDAEPLRGSFIQFQFNPNNQGVDVESDIDIFVVVPLPAGGALATVGLIGLAGVRRRRLV